MAGPDDPFTPGPPANPDQRVAPQQQNALQGFLTDPRGQAALLQFGLSLMGGRGWGDNPASQIGRAVGSAGEGVRAEEEAARTADEASSRIAERHSRAGARGASQDLKEQALQLKADELELKRQKMGQGAAEFAQKHALNRQKYDGLMAIARAKEAAATTEGERKAARDEVDRIAKEARTEADRINADYRRQQIDLGSAKEQGVSARSRISQTLELNRQYNAEAAAIRKENGQAAVLGGPQKPIPTYQEWLARQPAALQNLGGTGAPAQPDTTTTQPPVTPKKPASTTTAPAGNVPVNPATGQPFQPGDSRGGYRWNGGNFFDPKSWTNLSPPDTTADTEDIPEE